MLDQKNASVVDLTLMRRSDILKKMGPNQVDYAYQDVTIEKPMVNSPSSKDSKGAVREAFRLFSSRARTASA